MNKVIRGIFIFSLTLFCTLAYAQERLTVEMKNTPFSEAVARLQEMTGYEFIFNDDYVDVSRNVNLSIKEGTLTEALDIIVGGQRISYIRL